MVNKLISVLYGLSLAPQHKLKSHYLSGKTYLSSWCQKEGSFNKPQNCRGLEVTSGDDQDQLPNQWKQTLKILRQKSKVKSIT